MPTKTNQPTPNQGYTSNTVPQGGFFAKIYRGQDAPALLGTYRVQAWTPQRGVNMVERPDIDGGDNGWVLIEGKIEGGITIQLASDSTPTLKPGDFFKTGVIFRDSAGESETKVVVLKEMGVNMDQSARQQSGSAVVDKNPTTTVLAIDEY